VLLLLFPFYLFLSFCVWPGILHMLGKCSTTFQPYFHFRDEETKATVLNLAMVRSCDLNLQHLILDFIIVFLY
jgi:hypothetical protein